MRTALRKLGVPLLWATGAILVLLVGGAGAPLLDRTMSGPLRDTYYVVAHVRYGLRIAAVFVAFAGFYYWFPRITGYAYRPALGLLQFLFAIIGVGLTFFPALALGLAGLPHRYTDNADTFARMNLISTVGAYIAAASLAVFVVVLADALIRRAPARD
jgi:cytochrome c oxidase subunit I